MKNLNNFFIFFNKQKDIFLIDLIKEKNNQDLVWEKKNEEEDTKKKQKEKTNGKEQQEEEEKENEEEQYDSTKNIFDVSVFLNKFHENRNKERDVWSYETSESCNWDYDMSNVRCNILKLLIKYKKMLYYIYVDIWTYIKDEKIKIYINGINEILEILINFYKNNYIFKLKLSCYNMVEKKSISTILFYCIMFLNSILIVLKYKEKSFTDQIYDNITIETQIGKQNDEIICTKKISEYDIKDFILAFDFILNNMDINNKYEKSKINELINFFFHFILIKFIKEDKSENFLRNENKDKQNEFYFNIFLTKNNEKIDSYYLSEKCLRYFSHYYYLFLNYTNYGLFDIVYNKKSNIYLSINQLDSNKNFIKPINNVCCSFELFMYKEYHNIIKNTSLDSLTNLLNLLFLETEIYILLPGIENWLEFLYVSKKILLDYYINETLKNRKLCEITNKTQNKIKSHLEIFKNLLLYKEKKNEKHNMDKLFFESEKEEINSLLLKNEKEEEDKLINNPNENLVIEEKNKKILIDYFFYFIFFLESELESESKSESININNYDKKKFINNRDFSENSILTSFFFPTDTNNYDINIFLIFRNLLTIKFIDNIFIKYNIYWYFNFFITTYDLYLNDDKIKQILNSYSFATPFIIQYNYLNFFVLFKKKIYYTTDIIQCICLWINFVVLNFYKINLNGIYITCNNPINEIIDNLFKKKDKDKDKNFLKIKKKLEKKIMDNNLIEYFKKINQKKTQVKKKKLKKETQVEKQKETQNFQKEIQNEQEKETQNFQKNIQKENTNIKIQNEILQTKENLDFCIEKKILNFVDTNKEYQNIPHIKLNESKKIKDNFFLKKKNTQKIKSEVKKDEKDKIEKQEQEYEKDEKDEEEKQEQEEDLEYIEFQNLLNDPF